jgi:predicted nucleotidyltransferase
MDIRVADSTQVLPINIRKRIPQVAIDAVVEQIVKKFHPQRIILFGSYAHGEPRLESDVDLLVVMDTPLKEMEQAVRICEALDYHFGLDLLARKPATLTRRLEQGDYFLREVMDKGKILYEYTSIGALILIATLHSLNILIN